MNGLIMMCIAIVVLGAGYLVYGRWLAKTWGIDPNAKTPAYEFEDGVDYEPADTNVVFGHQFASIAGAGPINGPIQAAVFGWVPVLLWMLIGGRVLRRRAGLLIHVRLCEKQGPHHRLHH